MNNKRQLFLEFLLQSNTLLYNQLVLCYQVKEEPKNKTHLF